MELHDSGVSTLVRLSASTVAIRKLLFVLHSVMKYQPVDSYEWINHCVCLTYYFDSSLWILIYMLIVSYR